MKKIVKNKKLIALLMSIAILCCITTAVFAGPAMNPCMIHPEATYKAAYLGQCHYCSASAYMYKCGTCEIYGQHKSIASCENGHLY